ncbi:hypothetical protein [Flexithrix dorotheae]|uniref:hypothetical protein n=1 Tax=Flexithrix dorotheae TaxID=70993 RepID=UPI0003711611|nr:hypothetical protein [Flexithrix dorotheae]
MELVKNSFFQASFDVEQSTLTIVWLPETAKMTEYDYKEALITILDIIEKNEVKYWIGDTRNFAYAIVPELQTWTAEEFNPKLIEYGLKRMALLVPEEFVASLGIEQTVEEMEADHNEAQFITRYFDNLDDAQQWIAA